MTFVIVNGKRVAVPASDPNASPQLQSVAPPPQPPQMSQVPVPGLTAVSPEEGMWKWQGSVHPDNAAVMGTAPQPVEASPAPPASGAGLPIQEIIRKEALAAGLPEAIALGVAEQESGFNPFRKGQEFEIAPGKKTRAIGTFQILPETAARFEGDVNNPDDNIRIGVRYLKELFDKHGGDEDAILAQYGGVVHDTTYVPAVRARIKKYYDEKWAGKDKQQFATGHENRPNAPEGLAPTSPFAGGGPLAQGWQYTLGGRPGGMPVTPSWIGRTALHSVGLDPFTAEDRPNLGASVGGALGSIFGPGGRYAGAAIGGGAGNLYNEYFGPPPLPGSYDTATKRTLQAGGTQAAFEIVPDFLTGPAKAGVKSLIQEGISESAQKFMQRSHAVRVQDAKDALDSLVTRVRGDRRLLADESDILKLQRQAQRQAAREQAKATIVDPVQAQLDAAEEALIAERRAQDLNVRGVARAGAGERLSTRRRGTGYVEGATRRQEAALEAQRLDYIEKFLKGDPPPGREAAGNAVFDTVMGETAPVALAKSRLGARVRAEAAKGPVLDFTPAKNEAFRVLNDEILPLARTFPNQPQPAVGHLVESRLHGAAPGAPGGGPVVPPYVVGQGTPAPTHFPFQGPPRIPTAPPGSPAAGIGGPIAAHEDTLLTELLRGVEGTRYEELKSDPVMSTIEQILNAPNKVPFGTLHEWYSSLTSAKSNLFDGRLRSKLEGLQAHLIGELRRTLASGNNKKYEKAALEYKNLMRLFERGDVEAIQSFARSKEGPEAIVKMIDPANPTQVKALMDLLREVPKQAKGKGAKKGIQRGADAAEMVQQQWFAENILDGDIDGLAERIAVLDKPAHREFVEAFLGDAKYQDVINNTRKIAQQWQDTIAQEAAKVRAAKTGKATEIDLVREKTRAALDFAQDVGRVAKEGAEDTVRSRSKDLAAAQERARKTVAGELSKGDVARVDRARAVRQERAGFEQELQDARRRASEARLPSAEEQAFAESTLSPEKLRQMKGGFLTLMRRMATAAVGIKALGPAGVVMLGAEKLGKSASDRDLLKYVVHSNSATKQFLVQLAATQKPNVVVSQAARAGVRARRDYNARHPDKPVGAVVREKVQKAGEAIKRQ